MKIGIAFSGGAARATAHIGIIKALNECNIKIHHIAGTSGGAIIGSLFAAGLSVEEMTAFVEEGSWQKIYRATLPIYGITKLDYLGELLGKYICSNKFEDLKTLLSVVATNLSTGEKAVFQSGDLYQSVMASSAIPIMFNPIIIGDEVYADGGMFDNMPVSPLKGNCDYIIGCNVVPNVPALRTELDSVIKLGVRVFHLMTAHNSQLNFPLCDAVIEPKGVLKYGLFDFENAAELVDIGYRAAMEKLPSIVNQISPAEK